MRNWSLAVFGAKHWCDVVLLVFFVALLAITMLSMPLPSIACAQDVGLMLDAGWRYYQGQKCHLDYISPLGPLFSLLPGAWFLLLGPDYASLKLLPFTVSLIIGVWIYLLTRHVVARSVSLVCSIAIGMFAGGLFHPGFDYHALTFATFYNRVGYGLLSVAAVSALLPRCRSTGTHKVLLDASLGVALMAMLFLKVNFFCAGGIFAAASMLLYRRTYQEWTCLWLSAATVFLFFGASIEFRYDLMVRDVALALASREGSTGGLFFYPIRNFVANSDFFALVTVLVLSVVLAAAQGQLSTRLTVAALFALLLPTLVGFAVTLMQSHGDGRNFPTLVAGGLLVCAWTDVGRGCSLTTRRILNGCAVLLAVIVAWPHLAAYGFLSSLRREHFAGSFDSQPLREWRVAPFNSWGQDFVPMSNEALNLIRTHAATDDSLQYIDMANPFSFALGMRSPRGSMLWWDDRSTYSRGAHPDSVVFDDTDFILLPSTRPIQPQPIWGEIYGEFIDRKFEEAGRSPNFLLLRRKPTLAE